MELFNVYAQYDVTPERALGFRIYDDEDREYLDFYTGGGMVPVGHNHPHYLESMLTQMRKMPFYSNCVINPLQQELAQKLGRVSDYNDYSLFITNSTEEANECAARLASQLPKKIKNLKFTVPQLSSIDIATQQSLMQVCNDDSITVVADETELGFGRTGRFFSHQWYGIRADIITVGGAMGNGFPVGGVLISPEIQPSKGMLGSIFGGNYMASTAAIATVDIIGEARLTDKVQQLGIYFLEALCKLQSEFPERIREVRGKGLAVEIVFNEHIAELRRNLLYQQHVFTGAADVSTLRLLPPYIISTDEIDEFITKLRKVLEQN